MKDERQHQEVEKEHAGDEQAERRGNDHLGELLFGLVQAARDEAPDLINDPGHGQDESAQKAHLEIRCKGGRRCQHLKLRRQTVGVLGLIERTAQNREDLLAEHQADDGREKEAQQRTNQIGSQLLEMIPEGHTGAIGRCLGGGFRLRLFSGCVGAHRTGFYSNLGFCVSAFFRNRSGKRRTRPSR